MGGSMKLRFMFDGNMRLFSRTKQRLAHFPVIFTILYLSSPYAKA